MTIDEYANPSEIGIALILWVIDFFLKDLLFFLSLIESEPKTYMHFLNNYKAAS